MLKKLTLNNFQKHESLTLSFTNGINIIHGRTAVGKSCIRRAIEWCLFGANVKGVIRQGEKQCSVECELENGIIIERVRSKSVNRYILKVDGEEKVYDSIGKTVPEDIKNAVGIVSLVVDGEEIVLNSQPQMGLPFLFNQSPSFRAKIFNKLTGNDILDILFGDFNKDILRCQRELKRELEVSEKREVELSEKEVKLEKETILFNKANKLFKELKDKEDKCCKLLKIKEVADKIKSDTKEVGLYLKSVKIPDVTVLQRLTDKLHKLTPLKTSLESTITELNEVRSDSKKIVSPRVDFGGLMGKIQRLSELKSVDENIFILSGDYIVNKNVINSTKIPKISASEVTKKIDKLTLLKTIKTDLDKYQEMCYTLKDKIKEGEKLLDSAKEEYIALLKSLGKCPLCGSELTEKHIKEHI